MTIPFTEEMHQLFKEFVDYLDGAKLKSDSPQSIVEKFNRFVELAKEQEELALSLI